jgi:hypothetical protein
LHAEKQGKEGENTDNPSNWAEAAVMNLERSASAQSLQVDGRFNFSTLQQDLALEGLDNLSRSYSSLSHTDISLLHHRKSAINKRKSNTRPAIGPTLLHHGCALPQADAHEDSPAAAAAAQRQLEGFSSAFNRYVLSTCSINTGQGLGGECSQRSKAVLGHLHVLDCIAPLLPPVHASDVVRALNVLRTHVFATDSFLKHGGRDGSSDDAPNQL